MHGNQFSIIVLSAILTCLLPFKRKYVFEKPDYIKQEIRAILSMAVIPCFSGEI